ncbi:MAG TPA: hypothetical protein VHC70_06050, partial [Phycisphaerales bacterium]|nr:hypothetical protein [Phycisphaerales bacterium]
MRRGRAILVVAIGAGACGCQQMRATPAPEVAVREEAPARVPIPEWWQNEPMREGGRVVVCAMADGADLLTARREALEGAERAFRQATGAAPAEEGVETDSVRLRDGSFRAYV